MSNDDNVKFAFRQLCGDTSVALHIETAQLKAVDSACCTTDVVNAWYRFVNTLNDEIKKET